MLIQWSCLFLLFRLVTDYALKVCLCFFHGPEAFMDDGIFLGSSLYIIVLALDWRVLFHGFS